MSAPIAYLLGLATIPAIFLVGIIWDTWKGHVAWRHYCWEYERLTDEYDELPDDTKIQFLSEKPEWDNHVHERDRYFALHFQPKSP